MNSLTKCRNDCKSTISICFTYRISFSLAIYLTFWFCGLSVCSLLSYKFCTEATEHNQQTFDRVCNKLRSEVEATHIRQGPEYEKFITRSIHPRVGYT